MTVYPFSCVPDEFKGKRALITGGTVKRSKSVTA